MTFERPKFVSNILIGQPIFSDETSNLCDFVDFVGKLWTHTQIQKMLISPEEMGCPMRMFDTVLGRSNVILLVLKSHRNIPVILGNTWSTSVDSIVA